MLLSIVVPCFNEEEVLPETIKRLQSLSSQLKNIEVTRDVNRLKKNKSEISNPKEGVDIEIIYINDGSSDNTLKVLIEAQSVYSNIRVINFARNFGHQIAVTAGMDAAHGDAVVLIDCDLQDPPELILKMLSLWQDGYDVVYATRTKRPGETYFKKITASLFYRVINLLSDTAIPLDTGDFRLMDRRVVDSLNAMPERDRFVRGMVSWVGFRQIALPYQRSERFAGESKYPLRKMISFALTGILSFSIKPLKLASWLGIFSSAIAGVGIIYALVAKFLINQSVTGWTSLILAVLFMGGVQLFCIGVLGEYLGRIYDRAKDRPLYIVESYYGYGEKQPKMSRSPVKIVL